MNAVAAMDTLFIIQHAYSVFIIVDGSDRARSLAGALAVDDRSERAGLGTHAAGLALIRIDLHLGVAGRDGTELARVQAGFPKAEPAAVRHHMVLDRAVVTCCRYDGNHVVGRLVQIRAHPHRKTYPSADDLTLLVDTAPVGWLLARYHTIDRTLPLLVCKLIVPCHAADFPDHLMLQFNQAFIICNHTSVLSADVSASAITHPV